MMQKKYINAQNITMLNVLWVHEIDAYFVTSHHKSSSTSKL